MFGWTKECKSIFDAIKQYLTKPLILSSLEVGEELYMYLVVSNYIVRVVLFRWAIEDKQNPSTTWVRVWWTLRPIILK